MYLSRDLIVAVSKNRCFELADITFKIVTSEITDTYLVKIFLLSFKIAKKENVVLRSGLSTSYPN